MSFVQFTMDCGVHDVNLTLTYTATSSTSYVIEVTADEAASGTISIYIIYSTDLESGNTILYLYQGNTATSGTVTVGVGHTFFNAYIDYVLPTTTGDQTWVW